MQNILGGVVALVVIVGIWFVYTNNQDAVPMQEVNMGVYEYTCSNESHMAVTMSGDMNTIEVTLHDAPIPLTRVAGEGARYEGNGSTFVGAGEEVTFTINGLTLKCNPIPSTDSAPFNWGDAAEGGGVKQDTALIVSESIVGVWQSQDDAQFIREFKSDATVEDRYEGEAPMGASWKAFTSDDAVDVAFPLDEGAVYLQMVIGEDDKEYLTFKVAQITPETLELIYMDRGGSLTFTRVE